MDGGRVEVFELDIYTVVLAERATKIVCELERVPVRKRPAVSCLRTMRTAFPLGRRWFATDFCSGGRMEPRAPPRAERSCGLDEHFCGNEPVRIRKWSRQDVGRIPGSALMRRQRLGRPIGAGQVHLSLGAGEL